MSFKNQNHDLFVQKGSIHDLYVHTSTKFGKFLHSCQPLVLRKQRSRAWYEREKIKKTYIGTGNARIEERRQMGECITTTGKE
jgi:hypothetical protein